MKIFSNKLYTCTFILVLFLSGNFIGFKDKNIRNNNTSTDAVDAHIFNQDINEGNGDESYTVEEYIKAEKVSVGTACISYKKDDELLNYEAIERKICSECGMDITDDSEKHFENSEECRDYYTTLFYVQVGLKEEGSEFNEK